MKKFNFFSMLIVASFFSVTANSQNFRQVTDYTYPNISDAYFISNAIGWFVSSAGDVRKTLDGGVSWTKLSTNITDNLTHVYFLNENIGYAGSAGNKIFKTIDGGTNWTGMDVTGGTGTLYGIYFFDENKGWVLTSTSSSAQVLSTSNGGVTWNLDLNHTTGDMEDMAFIGSTNGIIVGGGVGKLDIFYTTNGTTWTKAPAPTLPPGYTRIDIRGVYMVNTNVAYAVGWGSTVGSQPSIHLKSTDGGATWTYLTQAEPNRTYDNLWAVYFKDINNGFAVGGATRGTVALRTNDAGVNWIPIEIPCGVQLNTINGFGDELIISGSSGVILKTTNLGDTWQLLTPMPNGNVASIFAVNNNLLYGGGFNSVFFKTIDGGTNWSGGFLRAEGSAPNIQGIYFVNENVGYSVHSYGLAAKTTNGGVTWKQIIPVTLSATTALYTPFFINENYGFVVGKETNNVDIIYKTTDGGLTWDTKTNLFATNLRGVVFRDVNNGIVVGEKLKAGYTTNGGNTWTASQFSSLPPGTTTPNLFKVIYTSGTNAIAVGEQLILRSSDDGATWNYSPVSNLVESINSAAFIDANNGWAVGSKTGAPRSVGLYYTSDAGASWSNKADMAVFDTMRALYDVTITPTGYAWIGGGSSAIYTNSPAVGINDNFESPSGYILEQNYPNPFNPTTKISWQTPVSGWQTLRVYDLLGNEITTLVNGYRSAGRHEIDLTLSTTSSDGGLQLASGIYFYQLRAGSFISTRKMILIR